ncbi:MAG: TonB-dependent receptor, partial [Hyphomonadaceae bacterium]|nr:TonB-dependent receptor [Hyphomonadaceae bacterium]
MTKRAGKLGLARSVGRTALVAFGAITGALAGAEAQAQEERDEIIVTAQRREQAIQDVPIAINAFNATQLEEANIGDVADLPLVAPSLFVNSTGSAASDTTIRIRGVGTTGNNAGLEGAVGVFIDGVYRNRSGMALGQLVDLQRIEVLRGPQSTLFGKNTTAGALSIFTRPPEFSGVSGGASMTFGDPDVLGVNGYFNVPVSDTLAFRITAGTDSREGFIENRNTGEFNQDLSRYFVRAQALWDISSDASLRLILDYGEIDNNGNTAVRARHAGARSVTINTIEANAGLSLTGVTGFDSNSLNTDPFNNAEDFGISGELNWDLSPSITLTNILAYRDYDRVNGGDSDFTGADILNAYATEGYETISNEFRIVGETGRLQWLAGVFYSSEDINTFTRLEFGQDTGRYLCGLFTGNAVAACFNATGFQPASINTTFIGDNNFNPNLVIAGEGSEGVFDVSSESWSIFAQGTWAFNEGLSATLGLRYIDDHKEGFGDNSVDNTVA